MRFEWDPRKAEANLRKHGVSFEEATTALRDDLSLTGHDPDHSLEEDRLVTFGVSAEGRLLVVAHTERIITARPARESEWKIVAAISERQVDDNALRLFIDIAKASTRSTLRPKGRAAEVATRPRASTFCSTSTNSRRQPTTRRIH